MGQALCELTVVSRSHQLGFAVDLDTVVGQAQAHQAFVARGASLVHQPTRMHVGDGPARHDHVDARVRRQGLQARIRRAGEVRQEPPFAAGDSEFPLVHVVRPTQADVRDTKKPVQQEILDFLRVLQSWLALCADRRRARGWDAHRGIFAHVSASARRAAPASRHGLVVDVLRMARLGEEEPALGQQAGRLRGQRQQPGQRRARQQRPGEQQEGKPEAQHLEAHPGHAHCAGRGAVEELARFERAAGHAHRLLHHPRRIDAGGGLRGGLQAGSGDQLSSARSSANLLHTRSRPQRRKTRMACACSLY